MTGLISERAAWHGTAVTILESATLNRVLVYPTQDMSEDTRQLILSYFARRVERTRHGWDRRERSRISARLTKLLISSPHVAADSQITFERVYRLWLGRINNFPPFLTAATLSVRVQGFMLVNVRVPLMHMGKFCHTIHPRTTLRARAYRGGR